MPEDGSPNRPALGRRGTAAQPIPFRAKGELVYETLRRAILCGQLQPGERVDQQRLASQLAVSRMPLRQALLRLANDGFLSVEPHRSAVVAPLSEQDMFEVYDMRIALESMLAAVAAERSSSETGDRLAGLIGDQERAVSEGDLPRFVEFDRAFHRALYEASNYGFACETVERLRDRSDRYIYFYASHGHGAEQSLAEHKLLVDAFCAADSGATRELTREHVERGRKTLAPLVRASSMGGSDPSPPAAPRQGSRDGHNPPRSQAE
jgi:DNA-binding GntR family transcriptional regulator